MDNLITGKPDNIAKYFGNAHFRFVQQDVTEFIYVEGAVDAVLHFASPASPVDYLKYPIPTMKVGSLGTHKALGLAKAKGAKFMLASTSEVYGDPLVHPQREDYWGNVNPTGPRGVYDEAKRFAEALTMAYHRSHGVDTRIIRIFNTYGPNMRLNDGRVVPNFFYQLLRNAPLTIYGDGSQTRSFCYVDDLVEGICRVLASDEHDPFNLGNPTEITINQLAETLMSLLGLDLPVEYCPLPEDDPKIRKPDISRATQVLGWQPMISFDDGMRKTYAYFKDRAETDSPSKGANVDP
jgi:dTDP-glucose 4,6-dehydratase